MKTAELTDALLDYWVAKAEGLTPYREEGHTRYWMVDLPHSPATIVGQKPKPPSPDMRYSPSVNPAHGHPIIERDGIAVMRDNDGRWFAGLCERVSSGGEPIIQEPWWIGPTALIAAMRAKVASVYGDEVPEA